MREDTGHPAAKSALDAIDENTVHTEDEFNALLDVINQFTISNQTHNGEIQYNYTPPTEVTLEEFGVGTRSEKGKFYFYEGGVRLEKRPYGDEFETVGPVDEDNTPLKGHPDYVDPDVHERRSMRAPHLPTTQEAGRPQVINLAQPKAEELDTYTASELDKLVALSEEFGGYSELPTDPEEIYLSVQDSEFVPKQRSVEVVRAHLPNIGMFEYDVIGIVKNLHSITLVFDPEVAKPPFYPQTRLTFTLEHAGQGYEVVYLGICFDFEGLKFMCFNTGG